MTDGVKSVAAQSNSVSPISFRCSISYPILSKYFRASPRPGTCVSAKHPSLMMANTVLG